VKYFAISMTVLARTFKLFEGGAGERNSQVGTWKGFPWESGPDFAQGSGRWARNARKKVSECMAKEPKGQTQPIVVIFPVSR
jgi:hypothetical protein